MSHTSLSLGAEQLAAAGTISAVAKTLGVADRTVAGWRSGKPPNRASIESIERLLGIPTVAWSRVAVAATVAPPTSPASTPPASPPPTARQSAEARLREQLERLRAQRETPGLTERSRVELEKLELQASARLARLEGATGLSMRQVMASPHVARIADEVLATLHDSPLELCAVLDDQFVAEHSARLTSINAVRDSGIEEAERDKTRIHQQHARALKLAESEHAAQRIERTTAVVGATLARLHEVTYSGNPRDVARAEILGKHFRHCDAATLAALGRPLGDEIGVVFCQNFVNKYPKANALGRFANPENWARMFDSGLGFYVGRANVALRNEYDVSGQLDALLALDAAVARIATEPGISSVDEAEALWAIRAACLPGEVAEARYQAHAAEMKARSIAAQAEETALRVAAARGDHAAREALNARGPGILESVIRNAASILRMTGLSAADAEREAAL